ncbi:unnamed protein product [Linum tenue]|uniref:Calcineurin-like phosphoesterase domain-containing protein n=1 Tax=Linum tenue TaxID=586396 RepID=A0AAV0IDU9_9ROSI|nr:unnamed protein product [Linum tenue]
MSSSAFLHAATLSHLAATRVSVSPSSPTSSSAAVTAAPAAALSSMAASARIAVVGDVHDQWNLEEDTKALQFLRRIEPYFSFTISCLIVLCDFGNENVELVQSIADLQFPKAAILGNHDSWTTQQFSLNFDLLSFSLPFVRKKDRIQLQLESLGDEHVGYSRLDFSELKISVVGGRPFSCGGDYLYRKKLLSARYGVQDMEGSARRIYNVALGTPEDNLVILLAHNGPTGLGSNLNDICGKDWSVGGGDHGDPDLAQALSRLKDSSNLHIPLIVFGHMHKQLAYRAGLRKMIVVGHDDTIYLNGAIVPRVKPVNREPRATQESEGTLRAFTLVEIVEGRVEKIAETWVSVARDGGTAMAEELVLFDGKPLR